MTIATDVDGTPLDWRHGEPNEKTDTLFVRRLAASGLDQDQIEAVLIVMSQTCQECWDASAGCHCWNDE